MTVYDFVTVSSSVQVGVARGQEIHIEVRWRIGRPRSEWKDNIKTNLKGRDCEDGR